MKRRKAGGEGAMARRVAILAGWAKPACWDAGGRRSTLWEQPAPWLLGIETLPATRTREEQARIARLWGGLTCISARARADLAFAAEGRPVCAHLRRSADGRRNSEADVPTTDRIDRLRGIPATRVYAGGRI